MSWNVIVSCDVKKVEGEAGDLLSVLAAPWNNRRVLA
jgi:hypothetical protein